MCDCVDNEDLVGADWYAANFANELDPDNDIGPYDEDNEDAEADSDNDNFDDPEASENDDQFYNGWGPGVVDDQENLQRFRVS